VQLISANNKKNDSNDAKLLAKLARVDPDLLSPLEHRSDEEQNTLLAIRARDQLVKARVAMMHSLRGMLKCYGVRLPRSVDRLVERCREVLAPELMKHLEGMLRVVEELSRQIEVYDEWIAQLAREQYPATNRLIEVPGVGPLTALTFVATLGDPEKFTRSRDVGSYLGLRPRQQQSGQKNPQLGITKAGDAYLRKLLVQGAHCLLQTRGQDTALRRWGLHLCERGGSNAKKRAVVAVARKMAVLLHKLWTTGIEYRAFPANA
jgi:transposase